MEKMVNLFIVDMLFGHPGEATKMVAENPLVTEAWLMHASQSGKTYSLILKVESEDPAIAMRVNEFAKRLPGFQLMYGSLAMIVK